MIVSCLALLVALGPAVRAADTIGSSDIIDESILSADIKNGEVKADDVGDLAITSGKLAPNSVGGGKIIDGSIASAEIINNSLTSLDIKGADITGPLQVTANAVPNGRCANANVTVGGAASGEVPVLALKGSVPPGILFVAVRVPSANTVTVKVCNFTGAASPAINVPARIMTFG